ncbi:hypothetical protein BU23DRAFT_568656 [Bimuria novae-zelandiae CBS 107.79]|uniref:Uncharacterized protein n=1 Tax=Bimuria novae-zelandiae CBS 107.79 TaxID=1447943 RepID=A0A6A5V7J4_9PLEO|nr:hypothetical protein BU23DRAFT_568656 [Bimuria novae-zelandiae CBS 107.79]
MWISIMLLLLLSLFSYAVADEPYHNHAVWFIGNLTTLPSTPEPSTSPSIPEPSAPLANGNAVIVNHCDYPVYICSSTPPRECCTTTYPLSTAHALQDTVKAMLPPALPGTKRSRLLAVAAATRSCSANRAKYAFTTCNHDVQGAYFIDDPWVQWGMIAPVRGSPSYGSGTEIKFVLCSSKAPLESKSD